MTDSEFDGFLESIVETMTPEQILSWPQVREIFHEELNNEVLEKWKEQFLRLLVTLPNPKDIDQEDIDEVMRADWFEQDGVLMAQGVSTEAFIGIKCSEDDPEDSGITLDFEEIIRIDDCLKRWSYEDGFYHA
jgi:hypothetical protein